MTTGIETFVLRQKESLNKPIPLPDLSTISAATGQHTSIGPDCKLPSPPSAMAASLSRSKCWSAHVNIHLIQLVSHGSKQRCHSPAEFKWCYSDKLKIHWKSVQCTHIHTLKTRPSPSVIKREPEGKCDIAKVALHSSTYVEMLSYSIHDQYSGERAETKRPRLTDVTTVGISHLTPNLLTTCNDWSLVTWWKQLTAAYQEQRKSKKWT